MDAKENQFLDAEQRKEVIFTVLLEVYYVHICLLSVFVDCDSVTV